MVTMNNIPSSLAPFFQEYSLADLDLRDASWTIIERTLQFGNRTELRWLFSVYTRQEISDWVQDWGQQVLPEPSLSFWQLILGVPVSPISFEPQAPFYLMSR